MLYKKNLQRKEVRRNHASKTQNSQQTTFTPPPFQLYADANARESTELSKKPFPKKEIPSSFNPVQAFGLDTSSYIDKDNRGSLPAYKHPIQKKENKTGLPDKLKSGVENLSGMAMDDVNVHYNSSKPTQLQAHAYAQGTDIHVASGQEKHLAHEAWHVVQQKQGRVKPTTQLKGVNVNDDSGLEREADVMGGKALQMKLSDDNKNSIKNKAVVTNKNGTAQLLMDITTFKTNTHNKAAFSSRKKSKVALIDTLLKAYNKISGSVEKFQERKDKLVELKNACTAYFNNKLDKMEGEDNTIEDLEGNRIAGIKALVNEINTEMPIHNKCIEAYNEIGGNQKAAWTKALEARNLLNTLKANNPEKPYGVLGSSYREPNISDLISKIQIKMGQMGNRGSVMQELILDDVAFFERMVDDDSTDTLLKNILVEVLSNKDNIHYEETRGRASGAVLASDKDREKGINTKYRLEMQMDQPSETVRQSSVLHEMTHIATQEAFENTVIHLAYDSNLSDTEILALSEKRTNYVNTLVTNLKSDKAHFTATQFSSLIEKAEYPIKGSNTLGSYATTFFKKGQIEEETYEDIMALERAGANNTLVEYDTVMNQMYFMLIQWGTDPNLSFFVKLKQMVNEAYQHRNA